MHIKLFRYPVFATRTCFDLPCHEVLWQLGQQRDIKENLYENKGSNRNKIGNMLEYKSYLDTIRANLMEMGRTCS